MIFGAYRPIDSSNKGRQLLEKLGWSSGQGLGKSNAGIIEPVRANALVFEQPSGKAPQNNPTCAISHVLVYVCSHSKVLLATNANIFP